VRTVLRMIYLKHCDYLNMHRVLKHHSLVTTRLVFLAEVPEFLESDVDMVKEHAEEGVELDTEKLVEQANEVLEKHQAPLEELPGDFAFQLHSRLVSYFLYSPGRFEKDEQKGLGVEEFRAYRDAMVVQVETVMKQYAPTEEQIEARDGMPRRNETVAPVEIVELERLPDDPGEIKDIYTLTKKYEGYQGWVASLQTEQSEAVELTTQLQTEYAEHQASRSGIYSYRKFSGYFWPEEDKKMIALHQKIHRVRQQAEETRKALTKAKIKLERYGNRLANASNKLKQESIAERDESFKKIDEQKATILSRREEFQKALELSGRSGGDDEDSRAAHLSMIIERIDGALSLAEVSRKAIAGHYESVFERYDGIDAAVDNVVMQNKLMSDQIVNQLDSQIKAMRKLDVKPSSGVIGAFENTISIPFAMLGGGISDIGGYMTHQAERLSASLEASRSEMGYISYGLSRLGTEIISTPLGLAGGLVEMVGGIVTLVAHPVDTVVGLGSLVGLNPDVSAGDAWETMGKALISWEDFSNGRIGLGIGRFFANVLPTITGIGAAGAGLKGAQAAFIAARVAGKNVQAAAAKATAVFAIDAGKFAVSSLHDDAAAMVEKLRSLSATLRKGAANHPAAIADELMAASEELSRSADELVAAGDEARVASELPVDPDGIGVTDDLGTMAAPEGIGIADGLPPVQRIDAGVTDDLGTMAAPDGIGLANGQPPAQRIDGDATALPDGSSPSAPSDPNMTYLDTDIAGGGARPQQAHPTDELSAMDSLEGVQTAPPSTLSHPSLSPGYHSPPHNPRFGPILTGKIDIASAENLIFTGEVPLTLEAVEKWLPDEFSLRTLKVWLDNPRFPQVKLHPPLTREGLLEKIAAREQIIADTQLLKGYRDTSNPGRAEELLSKAMQAVHKLKNGVRERLDEVGELLLNLEKRDPELYHMVLNSDVERLVQTECFDAIIKGHKIVDPASGVTVYAQKIIGEGGMGNVSNGAFHSPKSTKLEFAALKRPHEYTQHLFHEEAAGARLVQEWNHPSIMKPLHVSDTPGHLFILYETGDGAMDLSVTLGEMAVTAASQYESLQAVIQGLLEFHRRGHFHGDLKELNALRLVVGHADDGSPIYKTVIIDNAPIAMTDGAALTNGHIRTPAYSFEEGVAQLELKQFLKEGMTMDEAVRLAEESAASLYNSMVNSGMDAEKAMKKVYGETWYYHKKLVERGVPPAEATLMIGRAIDVRAFAVMFENALLKLAEHHLHLFDSAFVNDLTFAYHNSYLLRKENLLDFQVIMNQTIQKLSGFGVLPQDTSRLIQLMEDMRNPLKSGAEGFLEDVSKEIDGIMASLEKAPPPPTHPAAIGESVTPNYSTLSGKETHGPTSGANELETLVEAPLDDAASAYAREVVGAAGE
jgi:hypothetical protein